MLKRIVEPDIEKYISKKDKTRALKVERAGGELYIVGGYIRDILLGREPNDKDFCVVGITPEEFENIFPQTEKVGKDFPVYLLDGQEYALARTERSIGKSHKEFNVNYSTNITIEEDLKRRDFTINTIALDIMTNTLVGENKAFKDMNMGVIRPVDNERTFKEDPLRILRAARFASQLGFKTNIKNMYKWSSMLEYLPEERVFEEFRKALLSDRPDIFFNVLMATGCMRQWFKEIRDLWYVPQPQEYHKEFFVHKHLQQSLELVPEYSSKGYFRFAVLMHDIGKGKTPNDNLPHHYEHNKLGLDVLDEFVDRITVPNKWYKSARIAIKHHMRITKWEKMSPGKVVRLFKIIKRSPLTIDEMLDIIEIDKRSRGKEKPLGNIELDRKNIKTLYKKLFEDTGGEDIDSERYSGEEFGEQLFQYRCKWLKHNRNKIMRC